MLYTCQNAIFKACKSTQLFSRQTPVSAWACIVCCHSDRSCLLLKPGTFVLHYSSRSVIMPKVFFYPAGIFRSLKSKGLLVSLTSISRIIKKLQITGSVANLPCSGRPTKLTVDAKAFIDQQMRKNNETTIMWIL